MSAAPQRVVVVGGGMVGTRFVEELLAADRDGRFAVTVLGAESYEPYNRVLLSEVLAGRADLAALQLPSPCGPRVDVHRGRTALAVDRDRRLVTTDDGAAHPYDVLVLATGARAHVPDLPGLSGSAPDRRPSGVHVLRSVDDCRDVLAAAVNARRAVVVGGGLLGLEAATGLLRRGLAVTLVHHRGSLLDRQLDERAGAVLADAAADLGLSLVLGARPAGVTTRSGRLSGLRLDDGRELPADVLLLACGTRPETALAAGAGLPTDRGVLVTADLRSPEDHRVAAIGDCAQPPEGGSGLVAQGWDQARRLARALVDGTAAAGTTENGVVGASGEVVRLKAAGLDVVTMGPGDVPGARTVTLDDPDGRRHLRVSVLGERLVAATCVGAGDLAADLAAAFDRGTPVPLDPAALLVRSAGGPPAEASPTLLPSRATVCRCNGVTKGDVVQAWEDGAGTVAEVAAGTRATTGCGGCRGAVEGILGWLADGEPDRAAAVPSRRTATTATTATTAPAVR